MTYFQAGKEKINLFSKHQTNNTDVKWQSCGLKTERVHCSVNWSGKIDLGMLTANPGKNYHLIRKRYIQNVRNVLRIIF